MTPKLSVFLAAYNHEPYIRAALESVFAQQVAFSMEVVAHDDVSTDGTRGILDEFAARYPERMRLTYREHDVVHGNVKNILSGFEMCQGDYIATLDGDDVWTDKTKLQRQADLLDTHPAYWMCFHNCRVEYESAGHRPWELIDVPLGDTVTTDDFLQTSLVQTSTTMMRRALVDELRKWPQLLNDWFVGLVAARLGPVGYIDRTMSIYRQRASGEWSSRTRADQWALTADRCATARQVLGPEYGERIERAICTRSYMAAIEYERQGDYAKATTFLTRALRGKPAWLEPYCARYGLTGTALVRRLNRRLRVYGIPLLPPLWFQIERWAAEFRWRWLSAMLAVRSRLRARLGRPVGVLRVKPNPARSSARGSGLSHVDLEWDSKGTAAVEIRVGRPDGALLSHNAPSGRTRTGDWVADGMIFYLQDVLHDLPLTLTNTLDVARVRVEGHDGRR